MDYYQILDVAPTADEKQLKKAYLVAAKKYHPDIYKGVNKKHFTKVNEVYNILKNPLKRKDYDRKKKIVRMRDSDDFKAAKQKARMRGQGEFTYAMWQEMRTKQKAKAVRED